MIPKLALLAVTGIVALIALSVGPASSSHYVPQAGDSFSYYETIVLDNGTGNYSGYTEHQWINGTEKINASSLGTVSAYYNFTGHWVNNQDSSERFSAPVDGSYSFSSTTYEYLAYVSGMDGQFGYTNPHVWYYANNSLPVGASFYLLNSEFQVESRNLSRPLASSPTGYVSTISARSLGEYQRNDDYGVFNAEYTWTEYLDPKTGYVIGYLYTEQDSNAAGDGFSWTDRLIVTHTSYPLTPDTAPPATSSSDAGPSPILLFVVIAIVVIVAVVIIALLARSRRRPSLPRHSGTGQVNYVPGPPPLMGPPPPPIGLIPSGQPAVQQIVLKETVKVNCRYCGTLIDSTDTNCPNCGAPRA